MSRFGPANKDVLWGSKQLAARPPTQTSQSPKKKAFVSTVKSVVVFGVPPPLPPLHNEDESEGELEENYEQPMPPFFDPDFLASSHTHLLRQQTVRWLNLSLNLWSLSVLDAHRGVNAEGLGGFLDLLSWRARGQVSEEEFSLLYAEWIGKPKAQHGYGYEGRRVSVGVFGMRQLLLERRCAEPDLDLCIGIILHESNARLGLGLGQGSPVISGGSLSKGQGAVGGRWLSLCEELFFSLDAPGYGVLRFDEVFFLCACLSIGLQGWGNEQELEADLALATLSAQALQFMADAGTNVHLHGQGVGMGQGQGMGQGMGQGSGKWAQQQQQGTGRQEVTLVMFKRHLLRRGVGEAALGALLGHVRACLERAVRLAQVNGAEDLSQACRPFEQTGGIGSPRLWQQAVLSATGHRPPGADSAPTPATTPSTPSVVLFLLSDAHWMLSGSLRACELPVDGENFRGADGGGDAPGPTAAAANAELRGTVLRLLGGFRSWGGAADSQAHDPQAEAHGAGTVTAGGGVEPWDPAYAQRDPLYWLMLAAVLRYKGLQQLLLAALFDMTLSYFGTGGSGGATGSLRVACAGLVPDPQEVLVALGYQEAPPPHPPLPLSPALSTPGWGGLSPLAGASGGFFSPATPREHSMILSAEKDREEEQGRGTFTVSPEPPPRRRRPRPEADAEMELLGMAPSASFVSEQEVAQARWAPLIRPPAAGAAGSTVAAPSVTAVATLATPLAAAVAMPQRRATSPPGFSASAAAASATFAQSRHPSQGLGSGGDGVRDGEGVRYGGLGGGGMLLSLSQEEGELLARVLSAADPEEQISLLARMKMLRPGQGQAEDKGLGVGQRVADVRTNSAGADHAGSAKRGGAANEGARIGGAGEASASTGTLGTTGVSGVSGVSGFAGDSETQRAGQGGLHNGPADSVGGAFSDAPSDASVSAPNSIEELMQQGHGTGQYAAMLRDILRKMSRDDSQLQLKSLEQVLQLGHSIAERESRELELRLRTTHQQHALAYFSHPPHPQHPSHPQHPHHYQHSQHVQYSQQAPPGQGNLDTLGASRQTPGPGGPGTGARVVAETRAGGRRVSYQTPRPAGGAGSVTPALIVASDYLGRMSGIDGGAVNTPHATHNPHTRAMSASRTRPLPQPATGYTPLPSRTSQSPHPSHTFQFNPQHAIPRATGVPGTTPNANPSGRKAKKVFGQYVQA
ncbi:hypothetical protein B484DRAFT_133002 [Ochromonadaceae sp. CCMP2298]|nr:hypothetical protein B484DRAFT_133002 [Ochromonadaceae sp. CCMP2298]